MEALGGTALALCAKGQVVRFPSGLWPYPAPLTYLLPEGLLDGLSDQQLRDFFAYWRSSQPFSR